MLAEQFHETAMFSRASAFFCEIFFEWRCELALVSSGWMMGSELISFCLHPDLLPMARQLSVLEVA